MFILRLVGEMLFVVYCLNENEFLVFFFLGLES